MSMFTYVINILISLMMVSMIFVMLIMSRASGERIAEVLTEEPDLYNVPHAIREVVDGSIDFEQVGFAYPSNSGTEVISDLSIHIRQGETIGILGGTGSAKYGGGVPVYLRRADDPWYSGIFPAVFTFLQPANLTAFTAVEFYYYGDCGGREDFWAVG